jgi:hypothetical protein
MRITKSGVFGLALGGLLLIGVEARAVTVSFITSGVFDSGEFAGTSTYALNTLDGDADNDIVIDFTTVLDQVVDVPPAANVSFGLFDTSLTTATTATGVSSGFTLEIFELEPTFGGTATFVGALSGELQVNNSQAFIQFNPDDLVRFIGLVSYQIVSADDDILGRVNIPVSTSNPASIAGRVNVIPEPSAVLLVGMGAVAPLSLALRRRLGVRASA